MKHKLLSILLCLAMALSLLPTAALAEETVGVQDERQLRYALCSAPTNGTKATIKLTGDITLEMLYAAENFGTEKLDDNAAGDTFNRYKLGVHPTAEDPNHWNPQVINQTQEQRVVYGAYYHMSATDERIARLVVKAGQNIELDLNGHTIQKAARATHGDWSEVCTDIIGNYGTLTVIDSSTGETKGTIKGNGYISCVGAVLHNYEGATMTVGAVNVDGNAAGMPKGTGQYVIANDGGTITINGTNIYDTATSASLLVSTAGTMTITGNATLNHPATKTINAKGGTVEVGDVTITSDTHAIYAAGGTTNITGNVTIKASAANETAGTLTIDGGAITKAENVDLPAPSGSTWTKIGNTEVLVKDSSVAVVNGVNCDTLAAAIAAAKDGDTIKLLKDVDNGDGVIVPSGKNFTLDFDNHTYTVTQNLAGSTGTKNQCFQLLKDSTLTFKNGTIKANNGNVAMIIQNYSNLTLENMLLDGESITRNDVIIYTMSNNCGNVEIKDTKINTVPNGVAFDVYGGFGDYSDVTVTVTGSSEINGKIEVARDSGTQNKNTLNINGGTINGELKIDSSIKPGDATAITKTENVSLPAPSGYKWTKVGNTGVLVKENSAAVVNGVGYATLAAALNAVKNGETITLLKDVDENVTIPAGKSITLDLNGKTINGGTGTSSAAITNYGTVTITDSSTEKAGTIKRSDIGTEGETSYYVIRNLGKMTITTANVINNSGYAKTNPSGSMVGSSLICNGDGDAPATLTINGGAFEQQNFIVVKNGSFGILNVNGGKFTSKHSAIQNWYTADIKGGEINGQLWTDAWQEGSSVGETKIGGTAKFTGEIVMDIAGSVKPTLEISGGEMIVSNWRITPAAANKGAKPVVTGGNFSQPVKREYLDSSLTAELKKASGETPYSYYTSMDEALAAAKPGDTVTDLKAAEQKVTLTLKYNDGATADTTYNVASGTTITLPAPAHRSGYTFNGWYDGSTKVSSSYKVTKNVTLTASWSYNYSSGSSSYDPTYSVSTPSKTEHGSVTASPKSASKGDTVTVTVKPDSGYVLETLTVTDKNGNELTLKDKGNGKYTFTMPAGKVEVKATFMEDNSMLNFFYDVPNNAYFYEAVKWAVENGITTGVGNDLFAPEQPCTRAQIVTFLWRAAGSPEPKGAASGMTDVVSGSYYEKAVAWAIENGITTGTTTSTFSPDVTCTRAQAVTFLARALKAKAASAAEFSDVPTDSYFADAVAWAAANGVTEGIGGGLFGSDNDCTRGQIVTFLYRAYNK